MNRRSFSKTLALGGIGLSVADLRAETRAEIQQRRLWDLDGISFDNNFSGARLNDVYRLGEGRYLAISRPENRPINPSPWYGFSIQSEKARPIQLTIRVDSDNDAGGSLRASRPWLSKDGVNYEQLPESDWDTSGIDNLARIDVPAGTLFVFAWKPVTLESINSWIDGLEKQPFVKGRTIGLSQEGRPLRQLTIGEVDTGRYIVVLGGQHPPEITGNIGLGHFVEEICADNEAAGEFRRNFQTIVVPMINPDGKYHGHWRSTLGGMDSNRDWFNQFQAEVRATASFLLKTVTGEQRKPFFGIDFHSTNRDFFYIEPLGAPTQPEGFTSRWFAMIEKELGGGKVEHEPGRPINSSSNSWMFSKLKCPSYTREFRYNQDANEVARKARIEARMMMQMLLAQLDE